MGNGVSGSRSDHEDDLMSSPFPTFKSYTIEDVTSYDIRKGRNLCSQIMVLSKDFSSADPDQLMNHYAPVIIVYDQFYEELKVAHPSSILLTKTMQFRLSFISELITNILSVDCLGDDSSLETFQADTSDEQREALQQWVTKYDSEAITRAEYGYIGEALVKTLSDTHCGDKDWWKIYMWRRIYSHFLRITASSSAHDVDVGLERCSSLDLA